MVGAPVIRHVVRHLQAVVTLWGLLTTLNCAAKNYAGLVVLRVLLGCFESAVAPAYVAIPSTQCL
jgi:hypothetical protein